MKTVISLPDPLVHAVDVLASRLGVSRSELFRRAMVRFLQDCDDQGVTEALNKVYSAEPSVLDSGLVRMQAASLERDEW